MIATILMGLSTGLIAARFLFECFAQSWLIQSIKNMLDKDNDGFEAYFFFSNLLSECLCYSSMVAA
jgi:hypothetical protein